jgi:hypothetical protein
VGNAKDRARWLNELKNRSGKCEGPGEGGVDEVKNQSGRCKGLGRGGGDQRLFEKIFFF